MQLWTRLDISIPQAHENPTLGQQGAMGDNANVNLSQLVPEQGLLWAVFAIKHQPEQGQSVIFSTELFFFIILCNSAASQDGWLS